MSVTMKLGILLIYFLYIVKCQLVAPGKCPEIQALHNVTDKNKVKLISFQCKKF